MSCWELFGLAGSAVGAGVINAVAGGGTLFTFPTLLAFGTAPVVANATSTLALVIGTSGGMFGNRQYIRATMPWLRRFLPASLLGGLIGSVLLTHTSNQTFGKLIPFLIFFATLLFLAQGILRRVSPVRSWMRRSAQTSAASGGQPFSFNSWVAIYGGYFGAGIGILMLATLGLSNVGIYAQYL